MHASDPESPFAVDRTVIEAHGGPLVYGGKSSEPPCRDAESGDLASGCDDEVAGAPESQRRDGRLRSIRPQLLRGGMPAMDILVFDEVHPVKALLRRVPAGTFADHIAYLGYVFRSH